MMARSSKGALLGYPVYTIFITSFRENWSLVRLEEKQKDYLPLFLAILGGATLLYFFKVLFMFLKLRVFLVLFGPVFENQDLTFIWKEPVLLMSIQLIVWPFLWWYNLRLKRFVRHFWEALGYQSIPSKLLKGDLISSAYYRNDIFLQWFVIGVWVAVSFLLNFPPVYILLFVLIGLPPTLTIFWRAVPFLFWRAQILDAIPWRVTEVAFRLIATHIWVSLLTAGTAAFFEILIMHNLGVSIDALYHHVLRFITVVDYFPSHLNHLLPFIYNDPSFFGVPTSGQVAILGDAVVRILALLPNKPEFVGDPIVNIIQAAILLAGYISLVLYIDWCVLRDYWRTPKKWKEHYQNLLKAGDLLEGVRNIEVSWWQQSLFSAWIWLRWVISILSIGYALWLSIAIIAWFIFGLVLPGFESLVGPYSLIAALVKILPVGSADWLIPSFTVLLTGPLITVCVLSVTSWLITNLRRLYLAFCKQPKDKDVLLWVEFLQRYGIEHCRLCIDPTTYDLSAYYAAWLPVISVPAFLWNQYCDPKTSHLLPWQVELLFLHEVYHLRVLKWQPALDFLGAFSFVGQGYFGLLQDSRTAEAAADRYALEIFRKGYPEIVITSYDLQQAINNYQQLRAMARVRERPKWLESVMRRVQATFSGFIFLFLQDKLAYAHPETDLRLHLISKEKPSQKIWHSGLTVVGVGISLAIILWVFWSALFPSSSMATSAVETTLPMFVEESAFSTFEQTETWPRSIIAMAGDPQGNLVVSSWQGLFIKQDNHWKKLTHPYFTDFLSARAPYGTFSMLETDERLWIGGSNAVFWLDSKGLNVVRLFPRGIISYQDGDAFIWGIAPDEYGGLILNTSNGVGRFRDGQLVFITGGQEWEVETGRVPPPPLWNSIDQHVHFLFENREIRLVGDHIMELSEINLSDVRLHNYDGDLFWVVESLDGRQYHVPLQEQFENSTYANSDNFVTIGLRSGQKLVDNRGMLWLFFSSAKPVPILCNEDCRRVIPLTPDTQQILEIYTRPNGWLALIANMNDGNILQLVNENNVLVKNVLLEPWVNTQPSAIYLDQDENVWLGTFDSGIWLLDEHDRFVPVSNYQNDETANPKR